MASGLNREAHQCETIRFMVSRKDDKKPRSAYIICAAGSKIDSIVDVLEADGLRVLNFDNEPMTGRTILETTQDRIAKADIICAVLEGAGTSSALVELGIAIGYGKPVAVIGTDTQVPSDLGHQFRIRAPSSDLTAIKFQLQAFIANAHSMRAKPRANRSGSSSRSKTTAEVLGSNHPAAIAEREIYEAFRDSSEIQKIIAEPQEVQEQGYVPDFAIWQSEAPTIIGNPLVIEVKIGKLNPNNFDLAIERLKTYALKGQRGAGILVTQQAQFSPRVVSLLPPIFVFELQEIKELLANGKLIDTLRHERNLFVHSAH